MIQKIERRTMMVVQQKTFAIVDQNVESLHWFEFIKQKRNCQKNYDRDVFFGEFALSLD